MTDGGRRGVPTPIGARLVRARISDGSSPNILRKSFAKCPRFPKPHLKATSETEAVGLAQGAFASHVAAAPFLRMSSESSRDFFELFKKTTDAGVGFEQTLAEFGLSNFFRAPALRFIHCDERGWGVESPAFGLLLPQKEGSKT